MKAAFAALLLLCAGAEARPIDLPKKSVSLSRQFIVYCDDLALRLAVTSFVEETKSSVLGLLGETDGWKVPIVVHLQRAETSAPSERASDVSMFETEEGFKVEVNVQLGADPRDVHLRQQITRAVLLELAYRDQPAAIQSGTLYLEPPAWLIEGLVKIVSNREFAADGGVFEALIAGEKLLPLRSFLTQRFERLDATSRQLYCLYAMSFVQLLIELPDGRAGICKLLRRLPHGEEPAITLPKIFPQLAASEQSAEKWWSLGVARLAASDRYKGLSPEETERRLGALLSFRLANRKEAGSRNYDLAEFKTYLKNPQAREALRRTAWSLAGLGANAHPLFRPIVDEYQQVASQLARGKTSRVAARLAAAENYRRLVLTRMDEIADYLNWFEATQTTVRSDAFEDYLKSARAADAATEAPARGDAISRYLSSVAQQFQ